MPRGKKQTMPYGGSTKTSYTFDPVYIPMAFLTSTSTSDLPEPSLTRIDFSASTLPEYTPCLALILDNVLTPSECATLTHLASLSAATSGGWRPALVNAGGDNEILFTDYRNSDRIIWDEAEVVRRIWARCLRAEGLEEMVKEWGPGREGSESVLGAAPVRRGEVWRMSRLNERMRFLRYGKGMFFHAHQDGSYVNPSAPPDRPERSLLTLQLYLDSDIGDNIRSTATGYSPNDSSKLIGGATSFLAFEEDSPARRRLDVAPKCGRVLIFQHRELLHEGQEVFRGLKYTMRTDIMYERVEAGKMMGRHWK